MLPKLRRRDVVGLVLIGLGVVVIATAFYLNYQGRAVNQAMIAAFTNQTGGEEQNLPNDELQRQNPGSYAKTTTPATVVEPQNNTRAIAPETIILGGKTIAILAIPRINLKAAVAEGVDLATLNYSIGHFENTAMPGATGNFCVAGHRNFIYNEFFRRLDELKAGDVIVVTTKKGEFRYKVTTSKVVEPEEVSVLNPTKDSTITLVTCTPVLNPTKRLIVRGVLVRH